MSRHMVDYVYVKKWLWRSSLLELAYLFYVHVMREEWSYMYDLYRYMSNRLHWNTHTFCSLLSLALLLVLATSLSQARMWVSLLQLNLHVPHDYYDIVYQLTLPCYHPFLFKANLSKPTVVFMLLWYWEALALILFVHSCMQIVELTILLCALVYVSLLSSNTVTVPFRKLLNPEEFM